MVGVLHCVVGWMGGTQVEDFLYRLALSIILINGCEPFVAVPSNQRPYSADTVQRVFIVGCRCWCCISAIPASRTLDMELAGATPRQHQAE